jgi:hypothetical protein
VTAKTLDAVLGHRVSKRLVQVLWLSSVPLSAPRMKREYDNSFNVDDVEMRLGELAAAGVAQVTDEVAGQKFYVLAGNNAGAAVRRLGLGAGSQRSDD